MAELALGDVHRDALLGELDRVGGPAAQPQHVKCAQTVGEVMGDQLELVGVPVLTELMAREPLADPASAES